MRYKDLERLINPCQFSKNNMTGGMLFIFLVIFIFMSAFLYTAYSDLDVSQQRYKSLRTTYYALQLDKEQLEDKIIVLKHDNVHLKIMNERYERDRVLIVDVSAYTNRVRETDSTPNTTATMTRVMSGYTCAVSHDLKWLLGHRIYIYGVGVFLVQDLMDKRWKKRVDIYYDKSMLKTAKKFGVKEGKELVVLGKLYDERELKYEFSNSPQ